MNKVVTKNTQKRNIMITVISIIAVMVLFFGLFLNKLFTPREMGFEELKLNGVITFAEPRLVNDFELLDQNGATFDKTSLADKLNLVFFGFTNCPDICPTTMAYLGSVYKSLSEEDKDKVQIILVSLDPARDTQESMKAYVEYFNPGFKGLTGQFPQIMSFTNNLNVAFNKVFLDEGYTIDHTSNIAILNGRGDYAGFIRTPIDVNVLPRIIESTLIKLQSP